METYDLIIVGAGPAALSASIYASRYKLKNIVIGKLLGGELSLAHKIDNYPGFMGVSGTELAEKWKNQVEKLGAQVLLQEVGRLETIPNQKEKFKVTLANNQIFKTCALIIATGSERRRLNIPGEKEYMGRGVSYCHTCDAPFFKGKTVALIGGADSAVSGAVHTAEYASKVYVIYRKDKLRAEPVWIEEWKKIEATPKGETIYNTNITEILGDKTKVAAVKLDQPYQGKDTLSLDGVFIEIGGVPGTTLAQPLGVKLDPQGFVIVDDQMNTNIPGLYCAGDMTQKSANFKQAILAMAQGARAAASSYQFIKQETAPAIRGV